MTIRTSTVSRLADFPDLTFLESDSPSRQFPWSECPTMRNGRPEWRPAVLRHEIRGVARASFRCSEEKDGKNASGGLLLDANLTQMLASRRFYCFCPCFLACIFDHQLSELMFDSDSRRKLDLSSEMMRAHWLSCRNRPYAGNGVVADKYLPRDNSVFRRRGPSSEPTSCTDHVAVTINPAHRRISARAARRGRLRRSCRIPGR
jgi:hypothetical protein